MPPARGPSEDEDVLAELSELVSGDAPFQVSIEGGRVEGSLPNLGAAVLERLRHGDYAVQGELDLHGLTRNEAKSKLEKFLIEARRGGARCVLVVHGRGLHSEGQIAVLKNEVPTWLAHGRPGRQVLAFASARAEHGGEGALYVLLRHGV